MEPIEINAGAWYLRALRADDRVDDTPVLRAAGISEDGYVERRLSQWSADELYSWAVCVPETGEMVAEILLTTAPGTKGTLVDHTTARVGGWTLDSHDDAFAAGIAAVRRFAESALGLTVDGEWPA